MPVQYDDQAAPPPKHGRLVFDEPKKLEDTIPGSPEAEAAQNASVAAAAAAPQSSWLDDLGATRITPDLDLSSLWTAIKGAPETALTMANNGIASGVAGLTAPFVAGSDDDQANYIRDFEANQSYSPRGESAQKLTGALGEAFAPVENAKRGLGDTIMEATGSPALATTGYMVPDTLAALLGMKGGVAGEAVEAAPPLRGTPRVNPDDPVALARTAGMKLLPSDVQRVTGKKPGLGDRIAEAIAPEDTRRDFTMENQGAANQLQREKLGTPEGVRNNRRGIEQQKEPHFKTYQEVQDAINIVPPSEDYLHALDDATQRAGFPAGSNPSVTEVISALRTKARRKINNPNADDKLEAEGKLADQAADKLEDAMGTELKNTGQSDLLAKYQAARQSLGELNDAVKTQRGGNVNPQALRKLDKKNPGRMTGQTKMLADIAEDFPDVKSSMSGAGKKGATGEITKEGVIKKVAKKAARGVAKATGLGDRLLVESEGFQNRMGEPATPAERTYFEDYGKKPEKAAAPAETPPGESPQQAGVVPSKAVTLSGRLGLEPEPVANPQKLPETPSRLTADMLRPTESGGVKFERSGVEANRRAGDLELEQAPDKLTEREGVPYKAHPLADQLMGTPEPQVVPREMGQLDFHPPSLEQPRRLDLERPPGTVSGKPTKLGRRIKVRDSGEDLGDQFTNNASGESSASVEAINRVKQEKAKGQDRFLIDLDDTTTPLTGVDAVDRRARKGQVIVQRGVGKDEYTILDRGGLSAAQAKGRIQAAFSRRE